MLHLFMRCVCCDCVYPVTFSEQRNIQHRKNATSSANNAHANKSCTPPDLLDLWAMSEDSLAELRPESMPVCPVADPSNWQIYKVPTTSDWSNSPTGIIDLRPPAHHNEGRQLNTAVGRLLMLISTPCEHKVGLTQFLYDRWFFYKHGDKLHFPDVFTHMVLLGSFPGRQAAAVMEAALISIVHMRGHTKWSRNWANKDLGGTGKNTELRGQGGIRIRSAA